MKHRHVILALLSMFCLAIVGHHFIVLHHISSTSKRSYYIETGTVLPSIAPLVVVHQKQNSRIVHKEEVPIPMMETGNSNSSSNINSRSTPLPVPPKDTIPPHGVSVLESVDELKRVAQSPTDPYVTLDFESEARYYPLYATTANMSAENSFDRSTARAFRVGYNADKNTFFFQSMFGTYLATDLDHSVSVDRLWMRSFEQWHVTHRDGHFQLRSAQNRWLGRSAHSVYRAECLVDAGPLTYINIRRATPKKPSSPGQGLPTNKKVLMVTTVKPKNKWTQSEERLQRRSFANWQFLSHFLRVVVVTDDQQTADVVRAYGHTADDKTELDAKFKIPTYRGMFLRAFALASPDETVMMSNSDILFDDSLSRTVAHVSQFTATSGLSDERNAQEFLIIGRRTNVEFPRGGDANPPKNWTSALSDWQRRGTLFQDDAQDYFILSSPKTIDFATFPPLVVGGIAFDNFLVAKAMAKRDVHVFDATATLLALHQNSPEHSVFGSHNEKKSEYNSRLAHEAGGWANGKTSLAPFLTVKAVDDIFVHERHVVVCSAEIAPCYIHHLNQQLNTPKPNDAFSRPWVYQHN
eukprot:PhM_4_TR4957/c0_g1_i1/m.106523